MPIKVQDIKQEINIAGNGIVGLMIAYFCYLNARESNQNIRIVVRGQYPVNQSTAASLVPSISWNEILSVVPAGKELLKLLSCSFTSGGIGLGSDQIIQESREFIDAVKLNADIKEAQIHRKNLLIQFGQYSVSLWDWLYRTADPELKSILNTSNYRPCSEIESDLLRMGAGYRPDLYFSASNFPARLETVIKDSQTAGYRKVRLLQPDELKQLDPSLSEFCELHSELEGDIRRWKDGAGAIFRPAGCINTSYFLSAFAAYIEKMMGTYVTEAGEEKHCFRIKSGKVTGVQYDSDGKSVVSYVIDGQIKQNKRHYERFFVLCPGEAVGTVRHLGFVEPPHARFVGFTLQLNVPAHFAINAGVDLSGKPNLAIYSGVASASVMQASVVGDRCLIGLGGLKAFLGLTHADVNAEYAIKASLYQLEFLNHLYPSLLTACLGKNTRNMTLSLDDLNALIRNGYIKRGVGSRAVAFDGAPTIGGATKTTTEKTQNVIKTTNVVIATHFGSGGVTNAPGGAAYAVESLRARGFARVMTKVSPNSLAYSAPHLFFGADVNAQMCATMSPNRKTSQIMSKL
jgi:hypothetical protein